MISRAALLFIALIPAFVLYASGLQAGSGGVAIILHPSEQFCGHIPASSSAKYSFSVEPGEPSMSLVLRWKDANSSPQVLLRSPSGREIGQRDFSTFEQGRASSSFTIQKPEPGRWVAEIRSADVPAKGDDCCILIEFVRDGKEKTPPAKFNGLYRDYGVDEDGDGIYDYAILRVGVDVRVPGNYMVEGSLYDINNGSVVPISYGNDLKIGSQALELELDEMKSPGPYRLKNLVLYDDGGDVVDRSPGGYLTGKYSDLRIYDAELNGNYSDYGSDIDGDGLYDYLTLDVGVDVYAPGNYSLWGLLCDSKGKGLVWSLGFAYLLPGVHTMHVDFDGKTLWMSRVNGPYELYNLSLESGDSFEENLTGEDSMLGTYLTRPYNYTEFVNPA